jgi:predicted MFS family arabinose efflux permease
MVTLSPRGSSRSPASHLTLGIFLTFIMAVGTYPVFAIGALAPFIIDDLGLTRTELGSVTTALLIVATMTAPLAGIGADRLPGVPFSMAVICLAAVCLGLMALAPNIGWLIAAGSVYGLACGAVLPLTNLLLSQFVAAGARARLMGAKASGVQIGTLLSGLLLPTAAVVYGWRASLLASTAVIASGALIARRLTLVGTPAPVARHAARTAERGGHDFVVILTVYAALMGFAVSALATYLVLYGVEEIGLHEAAAGLATALLGFAGIASRLVWSEVSERTGSAYLTLVLLPVGGAMSVALVWIASGGATWLYWVGAFCFGATAVAWNAVGSLALVAVAPPGTAGRVSGIMQSGFYAGYAVAPVSLGIVVDRTGSYAVGWTFVLAALGSAAGWLCLRRLRDRRRGARSPVW